MTGIMMANDATGYVELIGLLSQLGLAGGIIIGGLLFWWVTNKRAGQHNEQKNNLARIFDLLEERERSSMALIERLEQQMIATNNLAQALTAIQAGLRDHLQQVGREHQAMLEALARLLERTERKR